MGRPALTEENIEKALADIRALRGDNPIFIKPTHIMLSPTVIEHFGSAEAALEAAKAILKSRGYDD